MTANGGTVEKMKRVGDKVERWNYLMGDIGGNRQYSGRDDVLTAT